MNIKRNLKRVLIFSVSAFVLIGIVTGLVLWRMGAGTIQDWIGSQIQGIANAYLNPKLSFTDLRYKYPLEVSLKNLHLTADDPAHPGKKIDIIACKSALLALGEIPRMGKPIVIQRITLISPLISAVSIEPRSKKFVGFSDLMKNPSSTSDSEKTTRKRKLSDEFRIRKVELVDGKIVYDPRIPGTVPMAIDQINTALNIEPADASASWYKLDTEISRKPVFDLSVAGQFNLDTMSTRDLNLHLMTDLGGDKLQYLPPELQEILKRYQAKGKLQVAVTGSMPAMDFMKGDAHVTLKLDRANVTRGAFHLPIDGVDMDSSFADGKATLTSLKISALGGAADLSGAVMLNKRLDADLHVKVADMVLEKLLANPARMSACPASLNFNYNLAASLMSLLGKAPPSPGQPLATISLKDFRLTSKDPTSPGKTLNVIACKNLDVAMTQPIISGQPIVVDKIILDHPVLSAVAIAPGSIEFAGVPLLPTKPAPPGLPPARAKETPPSTATMSAPGDMLRVKEFQLNGAKVMYDPRIPGTQRMVIDHINTSLTLDPADPGVYTVNVNLGRAPVFKLGINGKINIDHPGLQKLKLNLVADLQQHQLDFLPPQLQLVLQHTHAHGKLSIQSDASVVLADPTHGKASLDLNVANLSLTQGKLNIPVDSLSVSAKLAHGKIIETARLAALHNVFELDGSSTLNSRLDTDAVLKLKDVNIEKMLAALHPEKPIPKTSTILNADIELQSPAMVAISRFPNHSDKPVGTLSVHNFKLTTDNPTTLNGRFDFVSCDLLEATLSSLPVPGEPIQIDHVLLGKPVIRAIAMDPGSNKFAGFIALRNLAKSLTSPKTKPAEVPFVPSKLVRMQTLTVDDAGLYYNPWIFGTRPMKLSGISAKVTLDSPTGDVYRFESTVPADPDLHVKLTGRANVDTMVIDPLKLAVDLKLTPINSAALPPQLQKQLEPFSPEGTIHVDISGRVPVKDPTVADLAINITADNIKATANGYRMPIDHVRIPIHLQNQQATFLSGSTLGAPTISAFDGSLNLTGLVQLDPFLTSTLRIQTDGILLQAIMATKIKKPAPDLVGAVQALVVLKDAPLLIIAARAAPPPGPGEPVAQPSPLAAFGLPANWGSATIHMDHARLAGFELFQGMTNIAKSVYTDLLTHSNQDQMRTVNPMETADLAMTFDRDHIDLSKIHYEGELVGADGHGYVTLDQHVNLDLTGGPQAKLADMGVVGSWLKKASDSLLYYHVTGIVHKLNFEVKHGNGQPIVKGAHNIAQNAGKAVGTQIDNAKNLLNGLFNH